MASEPRLSFATPTNRVARVKAAERAKVDYGQVPSEWRVCVVNVNDVWVVREDDPWVIAYRLVLQTGRLVIGELRVYPRVELDPEFVHDALPPWDQTRDLQGVRAWAPPGGLTATVVHRITPGADVNVGRLIVKGLRGRDSALRTHLLSLGVHTSAPPAAATSHRKGGPPGRGSAFYRRAARVYLEAPTHPVQAVAQTLGITPSQARDVIYRARHRHGLLPATTRGTAGGADVAALQRIATDSQTPRLKAPQLIDSRNKNARHSSQRNKRA
jgi:hypothetical protein